MTESVDSAHALKLEAKVSEDKRNVDLRFMAGKNVLWQITADTKTIEHFISSLAWISTDRNWANADGLGAIGRGAGIGLATTGL